MQRSIRQFRPLLGGLARTRYSNNVYRELAYSPVCCDQSGKGRGLLQKGTNVRTFI